MRLKGSLISQEVLVILLALLVILGLFWVNYQFASNNPGGNDFLAHYVGTRSLLLEGISPYSDQVALRIQQQVFGRPAEQGEIEHRVVYPLYSIVIFAPFALIRDYTIARVLWMLFLELSLLVGAFLALRITKWRPKLPVLGMYFIFSVLWYHGFRSVINGNAVIVVSLFFTAAVYALQNGNDEAVGVLLSLSTIKPNLVILGILFILVWSVVQGRIRVLLWFLGSLTGLVLAGTLIVPDWILQNIWEILRYPAYNPPGTIAAVLSEWFPAAGSAIQWAIGGSLGLLFAYEAWQSRAAPYKRFLWTVCLSLVITQWIGITTDPGNFIILFLPFVLILSQLDERWKGTHQAIVPILLGVVFIGLWVLFLVTLEQTYQPMQSSIMFIPFPALVLIGLYWIRWWLFRSSGLLQADTQ